MEPHHHQQLQRFNYEFWFFAFGLKQPRSPCQRRAAFAIAKAPCAAIYQKSGGAVSPLAPNNPTRLAVDAKRLLGSALDSNRYVGSSIGKAGDARVTQRGLDRFADPPQRLRDDVGGH